MPPQEDRRLEPRVATRLKPGKLLSHKGAFIADCAITDRTPRGARVRLFDLRLFEAAALGARMILFDETGTRAWTACLVWEHGPDAGLMFHSGARPVSPALAERIAGRYYAVPD